MPLEIRRKGLRFLGVLLCWAILVAGLAITRPARADSADQTNVIIVVKEAETGQPIPNAKLTLQFREPGNPMKLKRRKQLSFSSKTNLQGRYKFVGVTKGTIRLLVTAERRQSSGQELELEQDNQVIEVKLRKPQPLL